MNPSSSNNYDNQDFDPFERRQALDQRKRALHAEIQSVDSDVAKLNQLRQELDAELRDITRELEQLKQRKLTTADLHGLSRQSNGLYVQNERIQTNGRGRDNRRSEAHPGTNYFSQFDWSPELKRRMKRVFGFQDFRLCQEGICNASMDGRDVVAVMPTGGGKSLTYQLPALLTSGTTLVISPLISLITDQVLHLHEAGIEACMLTGSASKEEQRATMQRLTPRVGNRRNLSAADGAQEDAAIKLVYVTPEKIVQSKTFLSTLQKMANAGSLARIVIDEAHCVSHLGHDFRKDYQKLSILRQVFPHVPILAVSATLAPKVLEDLLKVLRMKPVVDANDAPPTGTVYFSSPLYRKNLHYRIVPKPASAPAVIETMATYIMENHSSETGIVYCLSKKDAESVAVGLKEASNGKIRTGVYHADVADIEKERLHRRWRNGEVKVVCATIAFGLGIDKGDVRFILHHSMSKSLDGYYQESGRGGRDGKDSDCILYYRGQDVSRLSGLVCGEQEGQVKLYDMLRFAQNVVDCRKLLFAQYFSASSSLSLSAWSAEGSQTLSPCGHCDNCTRSPDELERDKDVTVEAWKILQIVRTIKGEGGKATLSMLSDLVRGAGGGSFESSNGGKGKGKQKEKVPLDVDAICGGKVEMHKDDVERLLITLLLTGYLKEDYVPTSYSINVYLIPGNQEIRLSRLSLQDVQAGSGPRIIGTFPKREKRKRASTGKPRTKSKQKEATDEPPTRTSRLSTSKGKGRTSLNDVDEEGDKEDDDSEVLEPNIANWTFGRGPTGVLEALQNRGGVLARTGRGNNMRSSKRKRVTSSDEEEGEDEGEGMRERVRARSSRGSGAFPGEEDDEVDDSLPEHERVRVPTSDEEIDAIEDEWEVSFGHTAGVHHSRLGGGSQPEKKRLKTSSLREIDTMSVIELSD